MTCGIAQETLLNIWIIWKRTDTCQWITESLCCASEALTTLFTKYHHAYVLSHVQLFVTKDCNPSSSSVRGIFQAKNTGVGCRFLLQGIFPTQGSNLSLLCLLHWQADSLWLQHLINYTPIEKKKLKRIFEPFLCNRNGLINAVQSIRCLVDWLRSITLNILKTLTKNLTITLETWYWNHISFMISSTAWAQLSGFLFCAMMTGVAVHWERDLRRMPTLASSQRCQLIRAVG